MRKTVYIMILSSCISAMLLTGCQSGKEKYTFRDTGIEQLNAGNYSEAIQSFDQALDKSDGLVGTFELDVLKYRAEAEYKVEDYSAAAHTYEVLSQVDEPRPEYAVMQNIFYIKAGDLDKAIEVYQAAYGPEAGNGDGQDDKDGKAEKKSESAGNRGKDAGSETDSSGDSAVEPASNQVTILLPLGQALTEAGRMDEARTLYQQAVDGGVQSDELYNRIGLCELEAGNLDQAMSYFDAGMMMPDEGARQKILYNQAVVCERKQDFAKALELLESYAATYGSTPEVEKEITFLKSR